MRKIVVLAAIAALEVDGTRAMCVPVGVTPLRTRRVQDLPEARSD